MRKAVSFNEFAYNCKYFNFETEINNGYGCDHPEQRETEEENGKDQGRCHCFCCPLGVEAEQQDLTDPQHPEAVADAAKIDWDGLCEDGTVSESEILLINTGEDATEEEKEMLFNYELYLNRYNKKWLDEHGIYNSLAE